jgi:hypothetical protein
MSSASEPQYVTLKDGFSTPIAPVLLALDLEARGFTLERAGDDVLIAPASRLTAEDREQIRHWKMHLLAILDRCECVQ